MRCKHLAGLIAFVLVLTMGVVALYPETPLSLRLECAPGADLTADPSTYTWTDITSDLSMSVPITHTRGSQDEQSESNSESSFGLRNNSGRYTIGNPLSDLYPGLDLNTPFRFSTNTGDGSGWNVEWIQYLSEAVDDWPSGTPHLCRAMVTCAGPFRRFGQGEVLKTALERAILSETPINYWKLEDAAGTITALNEIGAATLAVTEGTMSWRTIDSAIGEGGTQTAAAFNDAVLVAVVSQPMPWAFEYSYRRPPDGTADGFAAVSFGFDTSLGFGGLQFINTTLATDVSARDWYHYVVAGQQIDATNWKINIWRNGILRPTLITGTGTLGALTSYSFGYPPLFAATSDASITSVAIYSDDGSALLSHSDALQAYVGEQTHERMIRICAEQSVPFSTTAISSTPMGPQLPKTFLGILREGEETDYGQLDDSQGLVQYRTLSEFYNQTAALTINAAIPNRLFLPFNPVTDDQKRRNKVTASMPDGTSFTVINTIDVAKVGEYEGTVNANVESVDQLPFHAAWIANNVGVAPGKRYPGIVLDFLRAPDLLADFRNMRLSDRITITNPPRQHTRSDVDLILPGWSTVIEGRGRTYQLAANCAPYSPYQVGLAGDATHPAAWCQTGPATQLASALAVGATALSVTIDGPLFTTVADLTAHPVSVVFGGEICPVTSISGTSPQTINVVRTLPKAHTAGTIVQVYRPLMAAL